MNRMFLKCFVVSFLSLFSLVFSESRVVKYDLDIDYKTVNVTGNEVQAIGIDKKIPGPVIRARVGDTLEVTFHNHLKEESSIHWHGVLLPNEQDGVAYLTSLPILPGASHTYRFPVTHSGTYWYHSHTGFQKQQGVYGGIIFTSSEDKLSYEEDYVAVLSDWSDENPKQIMSNLKRDGDYYAKKKGSARNWLGLIDQSPGATKEYIANSFNRMGPMDVSDVAYDAFLLNGAKESNIRTLGKDNSLRLRVVNASSSTYFDLEFAGGEMTVIAADGMRVKPVKTDRVKIAIGETYDILLTLPEEKSFEFRANSEDRTGYASLFVGRGEKVLATELPKIDYYSANQHHSGQHHHKKNFRYLNDYRALKSPKKTTLSDKKPWRIIDLSLTGSMEKFIWSFDNKVLSESKKIFVRRGENIRFNLTNQTMMHHPIHLHGHFFRVVNQHGDYSPLKHTVNVAPEEKVTIEFEANAEKDWFFHCHNLYHMSAGMSRIVGYQEKEENVFFDFDKLLHDKNWFVHGNVGAYSNFANADIRVANTRNAFSVDIEYSFKTDYEISLIYERNFTQFLDIYMGAVAEKDDGEELKNAGVVGMKYVLPFLLNLKAQMDSNERFLVSVGNEHALTENTSLDWDFDSERRFRVLLNYQYSKDLSFVLNYDSRAYAGAGLLLTF
ncbi:Uncharacterized protein AB751O23_DA_00010 [Chlamydiales bacterium SCGC AB-751-O23]|jgi:FtsP/CotA-like multicopper oxidase with cupredoxin domain|nr:Uncharacterized protein AB751O23_DA_00010 [Chlamydiales bacterium SCGC AB-751-O23]